MNKKMNRNAFLKMGGLVMLTPFANNFLLNAASATSWNRPLLKDDLLERMVAANDKQVAALLLTVELDKVKFSRKVGHDFATLAASWCSPGSKYYHSQLIVSKLEILVRVLNRFQTADGTVNIGNLESPPDTAFLIEILTAGAYLLIKDNSKEVKNVKMKFIS